MLAITLSALAIVHLVLGIAWFSARREGYSQARHTISELGERGVADAGLVARFLFLPVGLLALSVAVLLADSSSPIAALALCLAVGYLVAAAFPCDPGSPLSGSFRQAVHNLGGAVQYVGGGFALLVAAEQLTTAFKAAGFTVLLCVLALSALPAESVRGLVQRVAELLLFGSLLVGCWQIA